MLKLLKTSRMDLILPLPLERMNKKLSIVVPCYNEINFITNLVRDIKTQDYPKELIEVFIVDGGSTDGTRELLQNLVSNETNIKILHNPRRTAPHALNLAIANATGDYIVRMDVHACYPKTYLSTILSKFSENTKIGNVGCVLTTEAKSDDNTSKGIALAMSSALGVGGAKFRTGIFSDICADTVPFGCFPRDIFETVGLFNESLTRSQDYEFNTRLRALGYKLILTPDVKVKYYSRQNYKTLASMYYQSAYTKVLSNKMMGQFGNVRQFAPPTFFSSILLIALLGFINELFLYASLMILCSYLIIIFMYSAIYILKRREKISLIGHMSYAILLMHSSYAIGYLRGILHFVILRKKTIIDTLEITR